MTCDSVSPISANLAAKVQRTNDAPGGAERSEMIDRQHFGPEPTGTAGKAGVHALIHAAFVGKTIAKVYLGDDEGINEPGEPRFESEYLVFAFTDGSMTKLSVGAGNSFFPGTDADARKILNEVRS
jgi:hypothetical protein